MKRNIIIAMSVALLGFSACTEDKLDEINKDNQHPSPDAVPAYLQLTNALMQTSYGAVSGDYAFYLSSLTEQLVGVGNNQFMRAELRNANEWGASATFNNSWNSVYSNLNNIKEMIRKIETGVNGSAGQYDLLGIAQILKALNFGVLTDMHGDIPYSEALMGQENMQPKLDAQQEIYADIIATLDEAIANIEQAEAEGLASVPAAQDIALAGDLTQWKATAYGLKARYLLHQSAVNASVYAEAKAAAQAAIDLGFEGCSITAFNGINCDNPWSAFQWSREYLVSSNTVVNLMKKYDDPRLTYYTYGFGEAYNPGDEKIAQVMMVIDQNTGAPIYAFPQWIDLGSQPAHLLSKAEVYFILAETQLRTGEDATAAFQTAVASAVSEVCGWFNDPVDAAAYAASLGTPTLQTLFEQKYLAQCVDEQVETFNDMRRVEAMGESYITLTNPMNTQSGINRYPKRLPYGNSSVSANPNVSEAYGDGSYIYSEPVWWAGGTR